MKQILTKQQGLATISGIIFGLGLGLSQMIDRQRELGRLDLAGTWDPTLLFVLLSAVGVTVISFRFVLRRREPVFVRTFSLPSRKDIDGRLIVGAAIFGVGWGLSGYCPGPGLAALVIGSWNPVLFLLALVAGMVVFNRYDANQLNAATTSPSKESIKSL